MKIEINDKGDEVRIELARAEAKGTLLLREDAYGVTAYALDRAGNEHILGLFDMFYSAPAYTDSPYTLNFGGVEVRPGFMQYVVYCDQEDDPLAQADYTADGKVTIYNAP